MTAEILIEMKCCFANDGHFVHDPILVTCGANACRNCINNATESMVRCFNCNNRHRRNSLLDAPINNTVKSIIQVYLQELFQNLEETFEARLKELQGLQHLLKLYGLLILFNFILKQRIQ